MGEVCLLSFLPDSNARNRKPNQVIHCVVLTSPRSCILKIIKLPYKITENNSPKLTGDTNPGFLGESPVFDSTTTAFQYVVTLSTLSL